MSYQNEEERQEAREHRVIRLLETLVFLQATALAHALEPDAPEVQRVVRWAMKVLEED